MSVDGLQGSPFPGWSVFEQARSSDGFDEAVERAEAILGKLKTPVFGESGQRGRFRRWRAGDQGSHGAAAMSRPEAERRSGGRWALGRARQPAAKPCAVPKRRAASAATARLWRAGSPRAGPASRLHAGLGRPLPSRRPSLPSRGARQPATETLRKMTR